MSVTRDPDQVHPAVDTPDPITVSATLWKLEADPAAILDLAGEMRKRADQLVSAQGILDEAADNVSAERDWVGDSADNYQGHRITLTRDLGNLAELIREVAGKLDEIAWILTADQGQLDDQWAMIEAVAHGRSGRDLRFEPQNADEAALVRAAIAAAEETRSAVDDGLVLRESALVAAERDLSVVKDDWVPRTLTVMNLNVGQGKGNEPWFLPGGDKAEEGTDPGDIDEIADIIAAQDADVVTLQEVFRHNANDDLRYDNNLESLLEERTGDDWEIYFDKASNKPQVSDGIIPDVQYGPFGNAVAVRKGDLVAGSEHVTNPDDPEDKFKLDTRGDSMRVTSDFPADHAIPDEIDDGEPRVASVVEVEFREHG